MNIEECGSKTFRGCGRFSSYYFFESTDEAPFGTGEASFGIAEASFGIAEAPFGIAEAVPGIASANKTKTKKKKKKKTKTKKYIFLSRCYLTNRERE